MDYVQEELLRQRNALAALMLGSERNHREPDGLTEQESERRKKNDGASLNNQGKLATKNSSVGHSMSPMRFAGVSVGGEENTGVLLVTGETTSAAGWKAQELSRAFQRDARRYDGGFSLY